MARRPRDSWFQRKSCGNLQWTSFNGFGTVFPTATSPSSAPTSLLVKSLPAVVLRCHNASMPSRPSACTRLHCPVREGLQLPREAKYPVFVICTSVEITPCICFQFLRRCHNVGPATSEQHEADEICLQIFQPLFMRETSVRRSLRRIILDGFGKDRHVQARFTRATTCADLGRLAGLNIIGPAYPSETIHTSRAPGSKPRCHCIS